MPSYIIKDRGEETLLTSIRTTDALTAMLRGLKDVLQQIEISPTDGRVTTRLQKVVEGVAEVESFSAFPSASVFCLDSAGYSSEDFSFTPIPVQSVGSTNVLDTHVFQTGEMATRINVELWCQDPKERSLFVQAIEDISSPVDWMSGVRVRLPHYFNTTATFLLMSVQFEDSEADASRRYRKALFTFSGTIGVFRTHKLPLVMPRAQTEVE